MELTILGSGTTSWDMGRACSSYHVRCGELSLLFDCGSGALLRMTQAELDPLELDAVFLSHVRHPDHASDVAALLFAQNYAIREGTPRPRRAPLLVTAPAEEAGFLEELVGVFPSARAKHYALDWKPLGDDDSIVLPGATLRARRVEHGETPALAYRLEAAGRSFVYSGDTGPCEGLAELAQGADLALIECSYADGERGTETHLHARQVGELAARAGVRRLLITHRYALGTLETMTEQIREAYDGPLDAAEDLAQITVGGGQD